MKCIYNFLQKSINESFARLVIIGFVTPLDPSANELNEIKTIVSEGVTNAIIHGYEDNEEGIIDMKGKYCWASFKSSHPRFWKRD